MSSFVQFAQMNKIQTKNKVIIDGYLRESQMNDLPLHRNNSYFLIPTSINIIICAYFNQCYSLFFVVSPEYEDNNNTIQCKSKLIHHNIQIMATSFLSLHLIDIGNKHIVQGFNDCNQLGFKDIKLKQSKNIDELRLNDFFNDRNMKLTYITNSKSEYSNHILIKTNMNEIYSFGRNHLSQCGYKRSVDHEYGLNDDEERDEPKLLQFFVRDKINIIDIKKGCDHTLFLSNNHILYGCGSNRLYQMGLKQKVKYDEIMNVSQNIVLPQSFTMPIKQIECTGYASFIVDSNDILYGVGSNFFGGLGFDANMEYIESVTKINIDNKIKQFECGENHICLMDQLYQIITFGLNFNGQCGVPLDHKCRKRDEDNYEYIDEPIVINQFFENSKDDGKHINIDDGWKIICGYYATYIFDDKYNLYVFGDNQTGSCLMDGHVKRVYVPTFVDNKTILSKYTNGKKIVSIVGSYEGLYIITE